MWELIDVLNSSLQKTSADLKEVSGQQSTLEQLLQMNLIPQLASSNSELKSQLAAVAAAAAAAAAAGHPLDHNGTSSYPPSHYPLMHVAAAQAAAHAAHLHLPYGSCSPPVSSTQATVTTSGVRPTSKHRDLCKWYISGKSGKVSQYHLILKGEIQR